MKKRWSLKYISSFQILILLIAIFSFINIISQLEIVRADGIPSRVSDGSLPYGPRSADFYIGRDAGLLEAGAITPDGTPVVPETGGGVSGWISKLFEGEAFGGGVPGALGAGVAWGLVAAGIAYMIAGAAGLSEQQSASVAYSVGAAFAVGKFLAEAGFSSASWAGVIGLGVGAIVLIATYVDETQKVVQFQCLPWEAPLGGANCEQCNNDPFRPCSEYRCRSLGQACVFENAGSEFERCVWEDPQDTVSPTITPSVELLSDGFEYTSHETRPTNLGTRIVQTGGDCIPPFTPLQFGVDLNEPGQCKIDFQHKDTLEEMEVFMDNQNFYIESHSHTLSLPAPDQVADSGFTINEGGDYDFYVRCRDTNGNENIDEFVFSICVDNTPDTTPPIIVDTSIENGSPVANDVEEVPIAVYTNEPAECRWSFLDQAYEAMETEMTCNNQIYQQNAQNLYTCETTLTGIANLQTTNYFMRCRDQPGNPENERNTNSESYPFSLRGTQELTILSVSPEDGDVVSGSTASVPVTIEVETSNGADEGVAECLFSGTGDEGSYVVMFDTGSFAHTQPLNLAEGNYEYFIRCVDAGGNAAEASTSFTVDTDDSSPMITRAYFDPPDALKLVTNEPGECRYSLSSCNFVFDEGLAMVNTDFGVTNTHYAEWTPTQTYYIKCRDDFGNEPSPNACSIIASATNIDV